MTSNKTNNSHYEVRGLFTSLRRNPAMPFEIQIQQFVKNVQQVLTHPNFLGYYIYMLRQTGVDKISDILKQKTDSFWKYLQESLIFGCENQALGNLNKHPRTKVQNYDTLPEAMADDDQYIKLRHE